MIAWLEQQDPRWRARITHVSMDISRPTPRPRLVLPNAHHRQPVPSRGVGEVVGVARATRSGAQRNRSLRTAETLTSQKTAKLHSAMRHRPGARPQTLLMGSRNAGRARNARSLLVRAGTTPDRGVIWTRLTDFYPHCADSEIHSSAGSRGP